MYVKAPALNYMLKNTKTLYKAFNKPYKRFLLFASVLHYIGTKTAVIVRQSFRTAFTRCNKYFIIGFSVSFQLVAVSVALLQYAIIIRHVV